MFKLIAKDGKARAGELHVKGKIIKTPFFMPVATKGSVKFMNTKLLAKAGIECIISNSLIFLWNPGLELVEKSGGIHKFINWEKGIFTDSGGFQSLDNDMLIGATDEAAKFKSPFDGQTHKISPEKTIEIQNRLGSDVSMCLDHVPQHDDNYDTVQKKTLRTHNWAKRCKEHHNRLKSNQLLFGIVQGGNFVDIRKKSIQYLSELEFDGLAQGGLAIGEPIEKMYSTLKETTPLMPESITRYLMGVGNPLDILECVGNGVDCFDSTFPTQNARHGTIFTFEKKIRLLKSAYKNDLTPLDKNCNCLACKNYSKAFIRHMLKNGEGVGYELATIHNITFMQEMMEKIRGSIIDKNFHKLKHEIKKNFSS